MPRNLSQWNVAVGQVARPHGVKGTLNVLPLTNHPERLESLETVCVCLPNGRRRLHRIASCRRAGGRFLLTVEGIPDRTAAEALRGALLTITAEMRSPLRDGEYYVDELIGMAVVTTDGRELGTLEEVLSLPSNDVYVTQHALIPAVKDVVVGVDLTSRRITVEPVEGLAPELGI